MTKHLYTICLVTKCINNVPEQGVPVEIPSQYKKISRPRRAINNTFMAQKVVSLVFSLDELDSLLRAAKLPSPER